MATTTSSALTLEGLRARRDEILAVAARFGARNVHVFGSVARGVATEDSDVDLLVDITADAHGFAYFGMLDELRRRLSSTLRHRVDVIDRAGLTQYRERVIQEAVPL